MSAKNGRGREFDKDQVYGIAVYISEMQKANGQAIAAIEGMDRIIMAYVAEYGEDIMTELFEEEGMIVDGEIVTEEESGRSNEGLGLDSQDEGEAESLPDPAGVEAE